ncbi:helix-turn-helix domain-containing protein [Cytophagaceae bacterium YF14B1]|uniref:Helix-turn-helix domain-containing protein n=1 Tax=Xanthocytophaga flava TaxID=3048013 RepID=A0AAE3QV34_9BACT|nr:helix-turn-helix domain-containing protein [Xanthocytophaga flavus]MDJ1483068.1 helix-turn-helix domain-containing protein [Xanthocytophaga flavus]
MTKELIIEGAHRLFLQYGVKSVTMSDIASKLGLSKKTLYTYFDNKDSLLNACMETWIVSLEEKIQLLKKTSEDPLIVVFRILTVVLAALAEYKSPYLFDVRKIPSAKERQEKYRTYFWMQHVMPLLQNAQQHKILSNSVDLSFLCSVYQTVIEKFIAENAQIHARWDLLEQYQTVLLLSLNGFLTVPRSGQWIRDLDILPES